ncbi:MAG: DUF4340 domain-containing protein [Methylophagaceae bacterium]
MTSRYLINLMLILVIAGLYWFNYQSNTTDINQQTLTTLSSRDIHRITIKRANATTIILEKSLSEWRVIQPLQAKANDTRIKLLLSILDTRSHATSMASDEDSLRQFGLAPAKVTLILNEQQFHFGDVETISNHRYILHHELVHLIDDNVSHLLNTSASSFIDNRLLASNTVITKITLPILNADNTISSDYSDIENSEGQWKSSDAHYTADQLTALISVWQHAYALQVLPIKQQLLATNIHKVTISYGDQQSVELQIVLTDKTLFIYDQQQQLKYQFPTSLAQQLLPQKIPIP